MTTLAHPLRATAMPEQEPLFVRVEKDLEAYLKKTALTAFLAKLGIPTDMVDPELAARQGTTTPSLPNEPPMTTEDFRHLLTDDERTIIKNIGRGAASGKAVAQALEKKDSDGYPNTRLRTILARLVEVGLLENRDNTYQLTPYMLDLATRMKLLETSTATKN